MSELKIKTYVPTLSSFGYVKELNNYDLFKINKLINYKDDVGLGNFFDSFVDTNFKTNFDKTFAIINLRSLCMGDEIKMISKEENRPNTTIKLKLIPILTRLLENQQSPVPQFIYENLKIDFKLPCKLYYSNFIDFLKDITNDVQLENLDYKSLSNSDKTKLFIKLKNEIIIKIKEHLKQNQIKYKIFALDESVLSKTVFSFYDNSYFYFLKFLFKNSLTATYNKFYHCCQKLNVSYTDFCKLSPAETDLLLAIFKKNNNIK
jgi:hypothetical protein